MLENKQRACARRSFFHVCAINGVYVKRLWTVYSETPLFTCMASVLQRADFDMHDDGWIGFQRNNVFSRQLNMCKVLQGRKVR